MVENFAKANVGNSAFQVPKKATDASQARLYTHLPVLHVSVGNSAVTDNVLFEKPILSLS